MKKLNGSLEEQFRRLRDYGEELLRTNEGSTVKIVTDRVNEDTPPVFKRMYVCLKCCRDSFQFCRPLIALDACHLLGPCQGQLMAAIGVDGNDSICPIA